MVAFDARSSGVAARGSATRPTGVEHDFDVDAELARVFGDGVRPLRFEEALFEAILAGWARQQQSRMLCAETIINRRRLVCRLQGHAGAWPWAWRAEHLEEWIEDLAQAPRRLHVSTLRNYQIAIRLFCDYLLDRRYPWTAICSQRLDIWPRQIVDERNLIVHTNEFEADPGRRPLSRDELVAFFDHCDAQVSGRRAPAQGLAGGTPGRCAVQDDLRLGAAPPRSRPLGDRRLRAQPAQARVRRVGVTERALRQGDGRWSAAAAQRADDLRLGGRGDRAVCAGDPTALRS